LTSEDEESQQESEASGFLEDAADIICPDFTFQQRVIGFGTAFGLGYLITFMSFKFFVELIEGYPVPFALNYSFGNILSLTSSWFVSFLVSTYYILYYSCYCQYASPLLVLKTSLVIAGESFGLQIDLIVSAIILFI
jgi:hypothetical protein